MRPRLLGLVVLGALLFPSSAMASEEGQTADRPDTAPTGPRRAQERGTRVGLVNGLYVGVTGNRRNPDPAYALLLDFGFPSGKALRHHLHFGYQRSSGQNLLRFDPLVFGMGIPVYTDAGMLDVEVELIFSLLGSETYFEPITGGSVSSGAHAQIVARYGMAYLALAPVGFSIRYFFWTENGVDSGFGFNWPLLLTLGLET